METVGVHESKQTYLVAVLCILVLLLAFFSRFLPGANLWGIDHLSYFPLPFAVVITAVGVFGCILAVLFSKLLDKREQPTERRRLHAWWPFLVVLAASAAVFYFIKPATYLLGDQQLQIHELTVDIVAPRKEIGTVLAYTGVYRLLRTAWHMKVNDAYAIVGCLSGAIFVFLLHRLVLLLGFRGSGLPFTGLVVLATAPTIFFFGYTENYTLLYVLTLAYLVTAFLAAENRVSLTVPLILLVLAIFFHHIGVLLIPSFILLSVHFISRGRHPTRRELTWVTYCALLILLAFYIILRRTLGPGILIPLFQNNAFPGYALFSPAHLMDIVNALLLLCPVGLVLLLAALLAGKRHTEQISFRVRFAFLAFLFPVLFLLTAEPELGLARDWDIFAFVGLTVSLFAITAIAKLPKESTSFSPALFCAALMALLLFIPWLLVNTNEQRSIERFTSVLKSDPHKRAYGYEVLAQHYRHRNEIPSSIRTLRLAVESAPENPRYYGMLGDIYYRTGLPDSALVYLEKAIETDSSYWVSYFNIGNLHFRRRELDKAEEFYLKAAQIMPYSAEEVWYNLGTLLYSKGESQLALLAYREALKTNANHPAANHNVSVLYFTMGDYLLAEHYHNKAVRYGFKPPPSYTSALRKALEELRAR